MDVGLTGFGVMRAGSIARFIWQSLYPFCLNTVLRNLGHRGREIGELGRRGPSVCWLGVGGRVDAGIG